MALVVVLLPLRLISADSCARPSFAPARNFEVGPHPTIVVVGDFNNDSNPDLAVPNKGEDPDFVSILLGNGDGTFQTAVNYTVGTNILSVVVGDFNRDTNLDLAALVYTADGQSVSILLGNGRGQFTQDTNHPVDYYSTTMAAGDLNGDGNPDIVTNAPWELSGHVLLGNGDGKFSDLSYSGSWDDPPRAYLGLGDFNSDGKPDLLTARSAASISIRLGNGDGTFQEPIINETSLAILQGVTSAAMGDFNRDGRLDLAFSPKEGNPDCVVLIGNGNGTFLKARTYDPVGTYPGIVKDDFNVDGKLDLALAAYVGSAVSVLLGASDGTFEPSGSFPVEVASTSFASGDFNRDGKPDLVVANEALGAVSVLLNTCGSVGPQLAIQRSDAAVRISWPAPSVDFVLESTTNLELTNWQRVVEVPVTNAVERLEVSVPLDRQERYFRLRWP